MSKGKLSEKGCSNGDITLTRHQICSTWNVTHWATNGPNLHYCLKALKLSDGSRHTMKEFLDIVHDI